MTLAWAKAVNLALIRTHEETALSHGQTMGLALDRCTPEAFALRRAVGRDFAASPGEERVFRHDHGQGVGAAHLPQNTGLT